MIRKVKTISEIYEEVKGYDLVITNDAPLATALNKLVETPRLDYLAMTPKQIASKFSLLYFDKIYEKYELILKITAKTKKPLKLVHQMVEKIFEVWMYNAKREFAEQFLSAEEIRLLKYFEEYKTIEYAIENFNEEFYGNKSIAVVGEDLFSLLDLEVLPGKGLPAVRIDMFTEEEFSIDRTHVFNSSKNLISKTIGLINESNMDETAIVLNAGSEYLDIIKSRLKIKGISVEVKNFLSDDIPTRSILSFLTLALGSDKLKVKEFIPVSSMFSISIDHDYGQYDFSSYVNHINKDKRLEEVFKLMQGISAMTYKNFFKLVKKEYFIKADPELKNIIELLELSDSNISQSNLLDIKYFITEFDTELGADKSGVLFVNAVNSSFIDRQIIIYLGLDHTWTKTFPDKDYLNKEEEEVKMIKKFAILLQQGQQRFYFVQDKIKNTDVIPNYHFNVLVDKEISSFSNENFRPVYVNDIPEITKYESEGEKIKLKDEEELLSISPSRFNDYFRCPKRYAFTRLLPQEKSLVFKKGTLLHNFAELYFNDPEFTTGNLDKILGFMTGKMTEFSKSINKDIVMTDFRIGVDAVMKFISSLEIQKLKLETAIDPPENEVMKEFGIQIQYYNTEQKLQKSKETMISGKIDLQYGNTIVDYKSGKKRKTEGEVLQQCNIDYILMKENEEFDFQAMSYISAIRKEDADTNFIYNYLLSDWKGRINSSHIEERSVTNIRYIPSAFRDFIISEEGYEKFLKDKKLTDLLKRIGYVNYRDILLDTGLKESEYFNKDIVADKIISLTFDLLERSGISFSEFGKRARNTMEKDVVKPFASAVFNLRTGNSGTAHIFKDDVEKFLMLIKDKVAEINKYQSSNFPNEPVFDSREICKSCDYLNLCIGNKLWN
ncbi:MAG: PD-(D/E)XK nuclease family protein [bacterium]|nr:PD-(D/E)XK nuclease family protein [bacterium]